MGQRDEAKGAAAPKKRWKWRGHSPLRLRLESPSHADVDPVILVGGDQDFVLSITV